MSATGSLLESSSDCWVLPRVKVVTKRAEARPSVGDQTGENTGVISDQAHRCWRVSCRHHLMSGILQSVLGNHRNYWLILHEQNAHGAAPLRLTANTL